MYFLPSSTYLLYKYIYTVYTFIIYYQIYTYCHSGPSILDSGCGDNLKTCSVSQVTVHPTASGWVYFRGIYTGDRKQEMTTAVRSDNGRSLNVEYNVWIEQLDGDEEYLQIVDHFETSDVSFTYEITSVTGNQHSPQFVQYEYLLNVSEASRVDDELLHLTATDLDPDQHIVYSIKHDYDVLPFGVNETTGVLRLAHLLDREDTDVYSFDIIATDSGTPERRATTSILVRVIDVNDNSPVFNDFPDTINIETSAAAGYVLLIVLATDPDEGRNGTTDIELTSSTSLFAFNSSSGELSVAESLRDKLGRHVATFAARDNANDPRSTEKPITINVVNENIYPPHFSSPGYTFQCSEATEEGINIGQVSAIDPNGDSVQYEMVDLYGISLPFVINPSSGNISTATKLDREMFPNYVFLVLAIDNGGQPTGPKTDTTTVQVIVEDVNDNAPVFPSDTFAVSVWENCPLDTDVLQTMATDKDAESNGAIANYSFGFPSTDAAFFKLVNVGERVSVVVSRSIDAEAHGEFRVNLVAVDGGSPALTSSALVVVKVLDVNDNPPAFEDDSVEILLPRSTVANTRIYTAHATDADVTEEHGTYLQNVPQTDSYG